MLLQLNLADSLLVREGKNDELTCYQRRAALKLRLFKIK